MSPLFLNHYFGSLSYSVPESDTKVGLLLKIVVVKF